MRTLPFIQSILAGAFIVFGLLTLFGIGITGLLFLVPGAVFAGTAAITQKPSRAATAVALAVDAALAYLAARRLLALLAVDTSGAQFHPRFGALGKPGLFDYLPPAAALALVGIGVIAVAMDWRALRKSPWF
jgi:hypothetical protein